MMRNFFERGKKIFTAQQDSVLAAAMVIMLMVILSQALGVVRQRVLLAFFNPSDYALFLAAFRLPDLVFEVLAFGAFSSAFIPVFSKTLKKDESKAWHVASRIVNYGIILFIPVAIIFSLLSYPLYGIIAPGFSSEETLLVSKLARILFAAQGIFVVSYVITGVLESSRRFLVPALAPIMYNIGIIIVTLLGSKTLGLYAPAFGVVIGACLHLTVQLPLAHILGFRFRKDLELDSSVKQVGKLAAPRVLELSILQLLKTAELFFASLFSTAAYTYLSLANSLQAVPISLFGVSLAKAALPSLTRDSDDLTVFRKTFLTTLYQMMFFIIPLATILIVLRVPVIRLIFGTDRFDWEATVQTGLILSWYAVGIPVQAALTLISRAFYALHDTRTPVKMAIFDVFFTIALEVVFVFLFHFPVWSLALANTFSGFIQLIGLYFMLSKKIHDGNLFSLSPIIKSTFASLASGFLMYFFLKTFDRSVWIKRISFISSIDALKNLNFESFVLDTRYTANLIILAGITALLGITSYIVIQKILGSNELDSLLKLVRNFRFVKPTDEKEPITTTISE